MGGWVARGFLTACVLKRDPKLSAINKNNPSNTRAVKLINVHTNLALNIPTIISAARGRWFWALTGTPQSRFAMC